MKIQQITLADNIITIKLDQATVVSKVWIDTLDNIDNLYNEDDKKHSYSITQGGTSVNSIQIDSETLSPELDTSAFVVTINGVQGFYYDDKELYYREIELLTNFCSTCLDRHQEERMVLFMTKYHLLQYAVANNLIEDQINYYIDLARMLNIDFKFNAKKAMCSGNCKRIVKCCNGCCSLC